MQALKKIVTVKNRKIAFELPDDFQSEQVEVIVLPYVLEMNKSKTSEREWLDFIDQTYGCLQDDPIHRGEQGSFEIRGEIL